MLRSADKRLHVNRALNRVMRDFVDVRGSPPPGRIITPASAEFGMSAILNGSLRGNASGAWPSANDPIALPFRLSEPMVVFQLGWVNFSSTSTNADIGIYSEAFARLVSTGAVARAGTSAWQWVDVTDTILLPDKYWLCMSNNATTANQQLWFNGTNGTSVTTLLGALSSTTDAHPLPDPLTNMVEVVSGAAFGRIPICGFAGRALV